MSYSPRHHIKSTPESTISRKRAVKASNSSKQQRAPTRSAFFIPPQQEEEELNNNCPSDNGLPDVLKVGGQLLAAGKDSFSYDCSANYLEARDMEIPQTQQVPRGNSRDCVIGSISEKEGEGLDSPSKQLLRENRDWKILLNDYIPSTSDDTELDTLEVEKKEKLMRRQRKSRGSMSLTNDGSENESIAAVPEDTAPEATVVTGKKNHKRKRSPAELELGLEGGDEGNKRKKVKKQKKKKCGVETSLIQAAVSPPDGDVKDNEPIAPVTVGETKRCRRIKKQKETTPDTPSPPEIKEKHSGKGSKKRQKKQKVKAIKDDEVVLKMSPPQDTRPAAVSPPLVETSTKRKSKKSVTSVTASKVTKKSHSPKKKKETPIPLPEEIPLELISQIQKTIASSSSPDDFLLSPIAPYTTRAEPPDSPSQPNNTAPKPPTLEKLKKTKTKTKKTSPHFPPRPISATKFGLVQEDLAHNPFHLLIATTFLNKTRGRVAIPLLYTFLSTYPTPPLLAAASIKDLTIFLTPLGLQRIRAERLVRFAKVWTEQPPKVGVACRKKGYKDSSGVVEEGVWEVAHLPGVGAYALDSWRMFCRDLFLREGGVARDGGEEEWRRVFPRDKELRAYLKWRWGKEGVQFEG